MGRKSTNETRMPRPLLMLRSWFGLPLVLVSVLCACSRPKTETEQHAPPQAEAEQHVPPQASPQTSSSNMALPTQAETGTGDLDTLLKERTIRVVVPFSKTQFYVLKGVKRGISYEKGEAFQKYINRKYPPKKKHLRTQVVFYPVPRDELFSRLNDGTGDIAIGDLTITPERQTRVDFSDSMASGIKEIAVTGPNSPGLTSLDDL